MKKIIALALALCMLLTMAACGKNTDETKTPEAEPTTVGETLLKAFRENPNGTAQEVADRLIANEIIQFAGGTVPVVEGLLSGFDNAEIKGFKEGVMFAPMMSSIAFVGYVFELAEDADVEAFKKTLKESANLRWNICVEAEELIVENEGSKVFFLMCPKSFEQPAAEGDGAAVGDMEVPAGDAIPAETGTTVG